MSTTEKTNSDQLRAIAHRAADHARGARQAADQAETQIRQYRGTSARAEAEDAAMRARNYAAEAQAEADTAARAAGL